MPAPVMLDTPAAPLATPPSSDGEDRARQIVSAAYVLLEEEGLEGLTIRAVLARTGLARRAFYERFAGKDDLVLAVFEETIRRAAALYVSQAQAIADPLERLHWIVTAIVLGRGAVDMESEGDGGRLAAALSREHLRLAESRPAELQAALAPLLALMAQYLAEAIAAGHVRACDPHRHAGLIYNLLSTTMHTEFMAADPASHDRAHRIALADDIWTFCTRGLTG